MQPLYTIAIRHLPVVLTQSDEDPMVYDITLGRVTLGTLYDDGVLIAAARMIDPCGPMDEVVITGPDRNQRITVAVRGLLDRLEQESRDNAQRHRLTAIPGQGAYGVRR